MEARFVPDILVFLVCWLLIFGAYTAIAQRSHCGHLRMMQHGRLFQNDLVQAKEWRMNRTLMLGSAVYAAAFTPWIFCSAFRGDGNLEHDDDEERALWRENGPLLVICSVACVACPMLWWPHRKDARTRLVRWLGSLWHGGSVKEELPSFDRSNGNIRCIAFRNDPSEFV